MYGLTDNEILDALLEEGHRRDSHATRTDALTAIRVRLFDVFGRAATSSELHDAVVHYAMTGQIDNYWPPVHGPST